jgi:hypothetical protein
MSEEEDIERQELYLLFVEKKVVVSGNLTVLLDVMRPFHRFLI